jgi:hypothetical protein
MKYHLLFFTWLIALVPIQDLANIYSFPLSMDKNPIVEENIRILMPAKGEVLRAGDSYKITWESKLSGNVQIDLYKTDKFERTIEFAALNVVGNGNIFTWQIPSDITLGDDYQIVIFDTKNKDNTSKSEIFSIQKKKKLSKWLIIGGSLGFVALVGAIVIILGRPRTTRLPDPPNPDE